MKLHDPYTLPTQTAVVVNASHLNTLIREVYLVDNIVIDFEHRSPGSLHEVNLSTEATGTYSNDSAEDVIDSGVIDLARLPVVMHDLALMGYLDSGVYIVRFS